jgi:hypothetical protein
MPGRNSVSPSVEQLLAAGETKRALKALERARLAAVKADDADALMVILGLGDRTAAQTEGTLRARAERITYAARQNVRFVTRRAALAEGEEWRDPFAPRQLEPDRAPRLAEPRVRPWPGAKPHGRAGLFVGGIAVVAAAVVALLLVYALFVGTDETGPTNSGNVTASPRALYRALLTTAYPDSQLPRGFSAAKLSAGQLTSTWTKRHLVGEVGVVVKGADPNDVIVYGVFATPSDARAAMDSANPPGAMDVRGTVPDYTLPSVWLTGWEPGTTAPGKRGRVGVTDLIVDDGNVVFGSVTSSVTSTLSGNVAAALALAKSAWKHLRKVETVVNGGRRRR